MLDMIDVRAGDVDDVDLGVARECFGSVMDAADVKSLGESLGLGDAPRGDCGEIGAGRESKVFGKSLGDCRRRPRCPSARPIPVVGLTTASLYFREASSPGARLRTASKVVVTM